MPLIFTDDETMNMILVAVVVVAVVVAALCASMLARSKQGGRAGQFKRRALMTANELEFFGRLVAALPGHFIFPQVSMGALLDPSSSNKQRAHGDRLRIAQQRVDYLVCDSRCAIVAVVELDDRTHSSQKDQLRDSRLEQAGIRTVRFQSRDKPTPQAIAAAILVSPSSLPLGSRASAA